MLTNIMRRLVRFLIGSLGFQLLLLVVLCLTPLEGKVLSLYTNHPTVADALASVVEEIGELAKDPLRLNPRLAVVDFVERQHRERNPVSLALEQRLSQMLEERVGNQSVPFTELERLRAEWNSAFPGRASQQLVEDLAGQAEADWMITGTHHQEDGLLKISLQLYELATESILWQALLEAPAESLRQELSAAGTSFAPELSEAVPESAFVQSQIEEPAAVAVPAPSEFDEESSALTEFADAPPPEFSEPSSNFEFAPEEIDELLEVERESERFSGTAPLAAIQHPELEFKPAPELEFKPAPEPVIPEGMRLIPGGEFIMGSATGRPDETPDHRVEIRPFLMSQHEVTNAEYARCDSCERGTGGFDTSDANQPVVYVDWENAKAYCEFRGHRLPTEAEWEYAARAGSAGSYAFGNEAALLDQYAWSVQNTREAGRWSAQPVGQKLPNDFELHDLHGNVLEWVADYYAPDYFFHLGLPDNPVGPNAPEREDYPLRVVRGGAWDGLDGAGTLEGLRSARRYAFAPWTRSFRLGFRCAADWNPAQELSPSSGGPQ